MTVRDEHLLAGFVGPDGPHLKHSRVLPVLEVLGVRADHLPRLGARPLAVVDALLAAFRERLS